ncbi:multiple cyclophane-containing RiPP AmcA [Micromonospora sp. Rc5]|uniref:multiple cyclophane-containing RiPP AmcA n=1 Tax=Micromonospora sp. Rc5 TaxID=1920666 RepID=UPI0034CE3E94
MSSAITARHGRVGSGTAMTVYVSRNAATTATGSTRSERPGALPVIDQTTPSQVDPPLYTHVWHRLFEQSPGREEQR